MGLPGSQRSVQKLVEEHYASLYRYAFRLSGSAADAEDLTQDAFCQAQLKLGQLRDLNRAMDWTLPDEDAVTVAGLVIHEAQTIPEPGQTFMFHHHRFQVLRRQRNQITALKVSAPLREAEEEANA